MFTLKLVENTTKIPNKEADWLMKYTVGVVQRITKSLKPRHPSNVGRQFLFKLWGTGDTYNGRYKRGSGVVTMRININHSFPYMISEHRYKEKYDIIEVTCWQEVFVGILAHELGHFFYDGTKEGEYKCNLLIEDVVKQFRKDRAKYDAVAPKLATGNVRKERKPLDAKTKKRNAYLRDFRKKGGTILKNVWGEYEVLPPSGYVFYEGLTSMHCVSLDDVYERLEYAPLVPYVEEEA